MLVTSSKNKTLVIINDIFKKHKDLTKEQKKVITDLVNLLPSVPNYHKDFDGKNIIMWFVYPILLNQYFTIYDKNKLVAFLSYGFLNKQAENKWLTKAYDFTLDDWTSGSNLWLIDCLAPYGHGPKICKIARKHHASNGYLKKKVYFCRRYNTGKEKISQSVI